MLVSLQNSWNSPAKIKWRQLSYIRKQVKLSMRQKLFLNHLPKPWPVAKHCKIKLPTAMEWEAEIGERSLEMIWQIWKRLLCTGDLYHDSDTQIKDNIFNTKLKSLSYKYHRRLQRTKHQENNMNRLSLQTNKFKRQNELLGHPNNSKYTSGK